MPNLSEQIANITEMENAFNSACAAVEEASRALEKLRSLQEDIKKLFAYYGSEQWFRDREDDSRGIIPQTLSRGVLTEDAVWDLQIDYDRLLRKMRDLAASAMPEEES